MIRYTYWFNSPRGFANEYTVGVATHLIARANYRQRGFERIDRKRALRELTNRGDTATQIYAFVEIDGDSPASCELQDRFELARQLRAGICLPGLGVLLS